MKKGEVRYKHYNPGCHMLVYGMSRSGKTTGYVLPTIFANAYSKEKPCFIVTDPKGELYELTVDVLKQQGYRIYKLDIINANYSNRINPLTDIWDAYQKFQNDNDPDTKYMAHQELTDLVDELMMALVPDDVTKKGDDI
jgi:type IV secretory pathway TraG/TraD family ATPase VirD4